MRNSIVFLGSVLFTLPLLACSKTPEPQYPAGAGGQAGHLAQGGYGAQGANSGQGAQSPQGGQGAQYGGTSAASGGGTMPDAPVPNATTNCLAIPPILAAGAAPLLKGMATKETRGMREDGAAIAAQCQAGQVYEQPIQLQAGKCYTIVGVGIGVSELDIELVLQQPPAPEFIAAKDQTTGPQAVLGAGTQCFKNPLPFGGPATIRIRSTTGNGVALAQVFSR